jgi:hypothetical protein
MVDNTLVAASNGVHDTANNSVFFFLVPPGAQVAKDGVFVARDQYEPTFHLDKGETSYVRELPFGPRDVYATWDDVGAQKYEVLGQATYDFDVPPDDPNPRIVVAHLIELVDSPRRLQFCLKAFIP